MTRQSSYLNLSQYKKPTLDRHTSPFHSEVREDKKQSFCHNGFCSAKSVIASLTVFFLINSTR